MRLKDINEYLEATKRTKERFPSVNFYIAGFIEEDEYKEKVANYGNVVILLGFIKDITKEIK